MKTATIGELEVSIVGLGCNQFGRKIGVAEAARVMHAALDVGVTFFDTSDTYGYGDRPFSGHGQSEEFIGKALRSRRGDVVLATKFGNPVNEDPQDRGGSRRYINVAVERSLRRLQTDYIDLYQIHRPDPRTAIEETLGALTELVEQGKVREIGCSNFTADQLRSSIRAASQDDVRGFASVQNEYSLLCRDPERDVIPLCEDAGLDFIPYFPLASGLLTGKYANGRAAPEDSRLAQFEPYRPHLGLSRQNLEDADRLIGFASDHGHNVLELAFAWLLAQQTVVSVIAGATTVEQIVANASAGTGWSLTRNDLDEIDRLCERGGGMRRAYANDVSDGN